MGKLYNLINVLTNNYFIKKKLRTDLFQNIISEFPEKYQIGKVERTILEIIIFKNTLFYKGELYFNFQKNLKKYIYSTGEKKSELKTVINDIPKFS